MGSVASGVEQIRRVQKALAGRWLITVGDSTARFFFAALLSAVNGSSRAPGLPLHTLPSNDTCSFQRNGWVAIPHSPHNAECLHRWRGGCTGYSKSSYNSSSGCVLDTRLHGSRHTFIWSTYLSEPDAVSINATVTALKRIVAVGPVWLEPIIIHAGGWWDIRNYNHVLQDMASGARSEGIAFGLRKLLSGLRAAVTRPGQLRPQVVELGLTACSGKEVNKSHLARRSIQAISAELGFHVLERMPSMAGSHFWANNPCHNAHP